MNVTSLNDHLHNLGYQMREKLLNNPNTESTNNICNEITEPFINIVFRMNILNLCT